MVNTLAVPCRTIFGFEDFITVRHIENMNKVILLTGTMVGYASPPSSSSRGTAGVSTKGLPLSIEPSGRSPGPTGS